MGSSLSPHCCPEPLPEHQQPAFTRHHLGLNFPPHLIPRVNKELCECPRRKHCRSHGWQLPWLGSRWDCWTLQHTTHRATKGSSKHLCKHRLKPSQIMARIHSMEIFRVINCWHSSCAQDIWKSVQLLFSGVVFSPGLSKNPTAKACSQSFSLPQ